MRKEVAIALFLVLYVGTALAEGEIKTIDFSNSSILLVEIGEKDGVRFDWENKNHKLLIRDISKEKQRAELTTFIEGAPTPYYSSLHPNTALELDFDRDDTKDLKITIEKIMSEKKAVFAFEKISKPKEAKNPTTKPASLLGTISFERFRKYYTNPILVGGVAILIIILISSSRFIRRKYRRMKRSARMD